MCPVGAAWQPCLHHNTALAAGRKQAGSVSTLFMCISKSFTSPLSYPASTQRSSSLNEFPKATDQQSLHTVVQRSGAGYTVAGSGTCSTGHCRLRPNDQQRGAWLQAPRILLFSGLESRNRSRVLSWIPHTDTAISPTSDDLRGSISFRQTTASILSLIHI